MRTRSGTRPLRAGRQKTFSVERTARRARPRQRREVGGLGQEAAAAVAGRRQPEQPHHRRRGVHVLGLLRVDQRVVEQRAAAAGERPLADACAAADDREEVVARLGAAVVAGQRVRCRGSVKAPPGGAVTNRSPVRGPASVPARVERRRACGGARRRPGWARGTAPRPRRGVRQRGGCAAASAARSGPGSCGRRGRPCRRCRSARPGSPRAMPARAEARGQVGLASASCPSSGRTAGSARSGSTRRAPCSSSTRRLICVVGRRRWPAS